MKQPEEKIVIRTADIGDAPLVMATWLNGNRYGNSYFEDIVAHDYFRVYGKHIKKILTMPETRIDIACLESDPNMIIGYIVYTNESIHWMFTKKDYRKQGIAKMLYGQKKIAIATSKTKIGQSLIKKLGLKFNPFIGEAA